MRIILVRHGETEENAAGIIQGHLPGRLSARGREQVERLGHRLARERIDAAYSSDLARARETTEAIMRHHPAVPVIWTEDLRERYLGRYQGARGNDVGWAEFAEAADVETHEQLLGRARRVLTLLHDARRNGTILLSGHGGINCAIVAAATGRSIAETKMVVAMENAGICVLEGEGGRLAAVTLNDTSHLAPQGIP